MDTHSADGSIVHGRRPDTVGNVAIQVIPGHNRIQGVETDTLGIDQCLAQRKTGAFIIGIGGFPHCLGHIAAAVKSSHGDTDLAGGCIQQTNALHDQRIGDVIIPVIRGGETRQQQFTGILHRHDQGHALRHLDLRCPMIRPDPIQRPVTHKRTDTQCDQQQAKEISFFHLFRLFFMVQSASRHFS